MIPIHVAGNMIKDAAGIELRDCEAKPVDRGGGTTVVAGPCKKGQQEILFTDYSVIPPRTEKRCI